MNPRPMLPLYRGALALRARVEWSALPGLERAGHGPRVVGVEVVEILAVDEDMVTWTNHKASRAAVKPGLPFIGCSHRRELIAMDALEFLASEAEGVPADSQALAKGPRENTSP